MQPDEILHRRVELATLAVSDPRSVTLATNRWHDAATLGPGSALEVCAPADELISAGSSVMVAACRLRDAGFGVAATGVCQPGHLSLVRRWPLTAIVLQPDLVRRAETPDGAAWIDAWAQAARRHDLVVVATGMRPAQARLLHRLGCTHGQWLNAA